MEDQIITLTAKHDDENIQYVCVVCRYSTPYTERLNKHFKTDRHIKRYNDPDYHKSRCLSSDQFDSFEAFQNACALQTKEIIQENNRRR